MGVAEAPLCNQKPECIHHKDLVYYLPNTTAWQHSAHRTLLLPVARATVRTPHTRQGSPVPPPAASVQPQRQWHSTALCLAGGRAGRGRPGARGEARLEKYFKLPSMLPLLSSPRNWFFSASTLSALPYGLDRSGSFLWCWGQSPPTTFYPCGLKHPSPDSLCVLGREREVL
jgi:hypothetical protein